MITSAERDHTNRRITTLIHAALMRRSIRIACPRCQHHRVFDALGLWNHARLKGWGDDLRTIARRFYCDACWRSRFSSQRAMLTVTDDPPDDGQQFAYPPEALWKKLVSRFRT